MPLDQSYIDQIKQFEGYSATPQWDYKQWTSGYGTRATGPNEQVSRDVHEQRLADELDKAQGLVDARYPQLPEGALAALTSLTYNAGPSWMNGRLGAAVASGDWGGAREAFLGYNRAGGQVLPGLVNRRAQEAAWLTGAQTPGPAVATGSPAGPPVQAGQGPDLNLNAGAVAAQGPNLNAASLGAQQGGGLAGLFGMGPQLQGQQPQGQLQQQAPGGGQVDLTELMKSPQAQPLQPLQFMQLRQPPQVNYAGLQNLLRRQT